jgi:hypothetical protein
MTLPSNNVDAIDLASVALFLLLGVVGFLGLAVAQVGMFSAWALFFFGGLVTVGATVLSWRLRHKLLPKPISTSRHELIGVILLLMIAAFSFARPAEYVVGGGDAGVYVNWAADIARNGALLPSDPLTAQLSVEHYDGFLRAQPPTTETDYLRFPGFYLSETEQGQLIPQFYPLQAISLAVAYSVADVWGALFMTPLWGVLGVWAFYLFARLFLRWPLAFLTSLLLIVTPLQLYFARYPTAELLTQYLIWSGLWGFTRYTTSTQLRPLWGLTAGLAIGMVFLARIDALPVLLLPAAWAIYLTVARKWRQEEAWFWIPFLGVFAYAVFHAFWYAYPYTYNTYAGVLPLIRRLAMPLLALVGVSAGVAASFWLWGRRRKLMPQQLDAMWKTIRIGGAIAVVLLMLYAYFVRPYLGATAMANYWYAQTQIPITNHENLVRLGWYLTPIGIGLAAAGFCVLILFGPWRFLWPWALIGGAFSFLYIYNILNNPFHIYAMRRYVPVVLPTFVFAGGVFLAWLWDRPHYRRVMRTIAVLGFGAWMAGMLVNGRLIWAHAEYAGVTHQIEAVAARFPQNAILLFVDPAPVGQGVVVGTPLHFLHDLPSYDLQEEHLSEDVLLAQIDDWQTQGYAPYLLVAPGAELPLSAQWLTALAPIHITYPFLEASYDHPPSYIQQVDISMDVYAIAPVHAR